jgi:tetratricopeptide (TPR) repeat protein
MSEITAEQFFESATNHASRGNSQSAMIALQEALLLRPNYAEAWAARGVLFGRLGLPFESMQCLARAMEHGALSAEWLADEGVAWMQMGKLDEARHCWEQASQLDPAHAPSLHNLGSVARLEDRHDDAIALFRRAVEAAPTDPVMHTSFASGLLRAGHLREGWTEFEWRRRMPNAPRRHLGVPDWSGWSETADALPSGLLIYGEQGFGDYIMFMRYAFDLKAMYPRMKIWLEAKKPLLDLIIHGTQGIDGVVAYGDPIPREVSHAMPIMSTARAAYVDIIDDIHPAPYLHVRPMEDVPVIKDITRIGICWHAGDRPLQPELAQVAAQKSVGDLSVLAPLGALPGVQWFSLQYPHRAHPFHMRDYSNEIHDFYDTARLIVCLDLVVTVDTAVAHLAGALGVPTIVMTPHDNCWRWFGSLPSSPWYRQTMQIRQLRQGDWRPVIEQVVSIIEKRRPLNKEE